MYIRIHGTLDVNMITNQGTNKYSSSRQVEKDKNLEPTVFFAEVSDNI